MSCGWCNLNKWVVDGVCRRTKIVVSEHRKVDCVNVDAYKNRFVDK